MSYHRCSFAGNDASVKRCEGAAEPERGYEHRPTIAPPQRSPPQRLLFVAHRYSWTVMVAPRRISTVRTDIRSPFVIFIM
jgi:hypothetical protein